MEVPPGGTPRVPLGYGWSMMDRVRRWGREYRRAGSRWLRTGLALGLMAPLSVAFVSAAAGQEARDTATCRCVDRDGQEIENCRCLRVFTGEPMQALAGVLSPRRAMIGVYVDAGQVDEADRQGARIQQVQDDSPAQEAGMEEGDIVVRVDGRSVLDPLPDAGEEAALDLDQSVPVQRFQRLVGDLEADEEVEFEVLRDGRRLTLNVTPERAAGLVTFRGLGDGLAELRLRSGEPLRFDMEELRMDTEALREHAEALREQARTMERAGVYKFEVPRGEGRFRFFVDSMPDFEGEGFARSFRLDPCLTSGEGGGVRVWGLGAGNCVDGTTFVDLNPELGAYFGTEQGVLVSEVDDASELGLRPGDVVLAVDGREVTEARQLERILASYGADEEMRLRVRRQGQEMEVLGRRR